MSKISKVNKACSVQNGYDLFDKDGNFVRIEVIKTKNDEIVKVYRDGNHTYINTGGWRLREVTCFTREKPNARSKG